MRHKFAIVLALAVGVSFASAANAAIPQHAPVQGQSPAPNVNLRKAPTSVGLVAGEPGLGGDSDYLTVMNAGGQEQQGLLSVTTRENSTVFSVPTPNLSSGWYVVHWNVLSEDGHPMAGDEGGWWAFGVKGTTKKSSSVRLKTSNPSRPSGVPSSLTLSMNGARVGVRTLTATIKWGVIVQTKWILKSSKAAQFTGATFVWGSSCKSKTRICSSTGILPVDGIYDLEIQVRAKTSAGSTTSVWTGRATIGR